mgnify:CR=1 FL=1
MSSNYSELWFLCCYRTNQTAKKFRIECIVWQNAGGGGGGGLIFNYFCYVVCVNESMTYFEEMVYSLEIV